MASQAEKLIGNMAESLGERDGAATMPQKEAPRASARMDGFTKSRDSGMMLMENIMADPNQVRKEFDEDALKELAGSIRDEGLISHILVEWRESLGKWVILAGERRFRACKSLGWEEIPCIFKQEGEELSEGTRKRIQLIENCQRADLTPLEQGRAFKELMELDGLTASQAATKIHVSKATVTQRLALLDLPEVLQQRVHKKQLSAAVAYHISSKSKEPEQQIELADKIAASGLGTGDAINLVADSAPPRAGAKKATKQEGKRVRACREKHVFPEMNGASVTIYWPKSSLSKEDRIAVAEQFLTFAQQYEAPTKKKAAKKVTAKTTGKKTGKEAAVKD